MAGREAGGPPAPATCQSGVPGAPAAARREGNAAPALADAADQTGRRLFGLWRQETAKEEQSRLAVGGMRRPAATLAKVPGLQGVGRLVREVLDRVVDEYPDLLRLAVPGEGEQVWAECRATLEPDLVGRLGRALGARSTALGPCSRWRAGLVEAFLREAGDPEVHLPGWLRDGAPTGVAHPIPACGIFPSGGAGTAIEDLSGLYASGGGHCNYASVAEHASAVRSELRRLEGLGYIRKYASWEAVTAALGPVVVSKLAALSKVREDGSTKLRLIVDMRRSEVNAHVRLGERIVLPRISDAIHDVLALSRSTQEVPGSEVELLVVDFADAFQTLGVHPDELRHQVVAGLDGEYYGLESVAFGGAGSPLLWGRAAAFLGRSGQALFAPGEARIELFVDDPIVCAAGSRSQRVRCFCVLLLWWLALGLGISWAKLQRGAAVIWIGAQISVASASSVVVSLPERFVHALTQDVLSVLGGSSKSRKAQNRAAPLALVQAMAGRASWAAGVVPCLGSMLEPIWAAIADVRRHPARVTEVWVPLRRIRHACAWILEVLAGRSGAIEQTYHTQYYFGEASFTITVDASPWGLGGFISHLGQPLGWFADQIWPEDVARLGVVIGSSASQAVLEALAILVAVRMWAPLWKSRRLTVCVRSDSITALGALNKQRSRAPRLAAVMREFALDLAAGTYEVTFLAHIAGAQNQWADSLSRLWEPGGSATIPAGLQNATRCTPKRRDRRWWRLATQLPPEVGSSQDGGAS